MIKDNERFFYRLHVVIDAFVIAFSYLFACFLQLGFFIEKDIGRLTTEEYLLPLFFVVPGLLLLYMRSICIRRNGSRAVVWRSEIS